jgi:hypothetical protein
MSESEANELARMVATQRLNAAAAERAALEEKYGQVWDTTELQQDFDVTGFLAPYVIVTRKADGVQGTVTFQHQPRYYFNFSAK